MHAGVNAKIYFVRTPGVKPASYVLHERTSEMSQILALITSERKKFEAERVLHEQRIDMLIGCLNTRLERVMELTKPSGNVLIDEPLNYDGMIN